MENVFGFLVGFCVVSIEFMWNAGDSFNCVWCVAHESDLNF